MQFAALQLCSLPFGKVQPTGSVYLFQLLEYSSSVCYFGSSAQQRGRKSLVQSAFTPQHYKALRICKEFRFLRHNW